MKLGLITPGFSSTETDWCIPVLLNLVRELARDHEVHVFALRYPYKNESYRVHDATVHAFGGGGARGAQRPPILGRALAALLREHRRAPFDILHGLWADEPGMIATTAGRLVRVPTIVSLLGGELVALPDISYGGQLSPTNRWLIRRALNGAHKVTVGSKYLQGLAAPFVDEHRLALLPLGVDTALFHPTPSRSLHPAAVNVLHVGSLAPVKDHRTVIHAFAQAAQRIPDAHLHLVGQGPLLEPLRQLARSLGVADRVHFYGALAHDRLPAFYCGADLCVLSSRYESQAMVVLEAAACARPTTGTAVGILPEFGRAARTVPVGDAAALGAQMIELLGDDGLRVEMGRAARELVAARFSLARTTEALVELYAQAADTRAQL